MKNILTFFNDFKIEFSKIEWPTEKETSSLTILVIVMCLIMGTYVGVFDLLITKLLSYIL